MTTQRKPRQTQKAIATMPPADRAAQVLRFDERRAELATMAEESKRIVEIRDTVSRDECHSARMVLKNTRISIEKAGKEAREDAQKFAKAVIGKEKELLDVIVPEEDRLEALQRSWDEAREADKRALREAEEKRIRAENEALDAIRNLPVEMLGKSANDIAEADANLLARNLADEFDPSALEHAENVRRTASEKLSTLIQTARDLERERAESARLRAEAAEAQAAQARADAERQEREAQEKREAQERAQEAERADKERRDREALEREHIEDLRGIPLQHLGDSVAQLAAAIEETAALDPVTVLSGDALELAYKVRDEAVARLQQMHAGAVERAAERQANEERAKAEAEERRVAAQAAQEAAQAARLQTLRETAAPLPASALDALALLASLGKADDDVSIRLRFAIERDRDVIQRIFKTLLTGTHFSTEEAQQRMLDRLDFASEYVSHGATELRDTSNAA